MNEAKNVLAELKEYYGSIKCLVSEVGDYFDDIELSDGMYKVSLVEENRGDGDGAATYFIFEVKKSDDEMKPFLFRATGTRSSWGDDYYDDEVEIVIGEEVVVTQYFKA